MHNSLWHTFIHVEYTALLIIYFWVHSQRKRLSITLVAYILHYSTYAKGKGQLANLKKSICFCERCCMWVSNSSLVSVVPYSRDLPRKTLITSLFEISRPTCSIKSYLHTYVHKKTLVQMKINSLMYIDL